ncbi:50S ribosomal protein L25/general stress protein Ctc [Lederbergia graminis]|uniref:Large ribosomal subunit protein bL25 n=1 Tax=Lederbergia graminis TaxID=735518 RepID=A0ABW0LK30_9BACI|nr:50S ribosomal protein L25/general stress protein Ctc [Paenibacillus bovis]HLU22936.1 50S ribosomal protein L25/general stress protein Ctc [Bacillaceae bacterium]
MSTVLTAKKRKSQRQSQLSEVRKQGGIPGIVYGYQVENTSIAIDSSDFIKVMREVGRNGVISLDLEGKKLNVVLHEYQEDPLRNEVTHADFLAIDLKQEMEANVRVELSSGSIGESNGGIVQQILHEITVTAIPSEIPEVISVDISNLNIGESIAIGDIRGNYNITINHEDDETIANIAPPRTEEESTDEATPEEPEVIGEKASEEE